MSFLNSFFLMGDLPLNSQSGDYIIGFMILSYLVAAFGSFVTILLADRMQTASHQSEAFMYRIVGAICLGTAIWTMHFVGMFAYHFQIYIEYDLAVTILSLAFAVFFSYIALSFVKNNMTSWHYIAAALMAGTAVTAMHYVGMSAMHMDAELRYYPGLFAVSYIIAVVASGAATWMMTMLTQYHKEYKRFFQILAACVMGVAVCGMHYTGIMAMVIIPDENCRYDTNQDFVFLISIILFLGVLVIWGGLFFSTYRKKSNDLSVFKKTSSFSAQIILCFTIILFLMIGSIWFISNITSQATISEWVSAQRRTVAKTILEKLNKDTSQVQSLAFALMNQAKFTDLDDMHSLKKIAPIILDYPTTKNIIAGGGVWPEPYVFDDQKERDSYFWGKDETGKFKFFNDYNISEGIKYFQEEWYAPVSYMPEGKCYWSGSYIDAYSKEPMVTCSLPIYRDKKYVGVTTIDMQLSYIHNFLKEKSKELGGYALLLDRDNRFISSPDIKNMINDKNLFMTSDEFVAENPWFSIVNKTLNDINQILKEHVDLDSKSKKISKELQVKSPNISPEMSLNIAAIINDLHQADNVGPNDHEIDTLAEETITIDHDQFLKTSTDANIFIDHNNHWKLIIATPQSLTVTETQKILFPVIGVTILASSIALAIFYFIIQFIMIRPVKTIVTKLEDQQKIGMTDHNKLYDGTHNELGMIKYLFDKRSNDLQSFVDMANKANQGKSLFLANMSHELRTPLNSILGMLQLIDPKRVPDDVAEMHDLMSKSGHSLLQIVNDILDISKIEADGLQLETIHFDIAKKIEETVQILLPLASQKGLRLSLNRPDSPVYVMGDPLRIARIVTNLISNAIRYTEQGRIDVVMTVQENNSGKVNVVLFVKDTGIGIPADKHGTIFEKFTQADNSTTRRFGGTGLGLAITKDLVELMDGTIGLESEVGQGTKFWVNIPFKKSLADVTINEESIDQQASLPIDDVPRIPITDVRILVAEDHIMNQAFMKRLFQNLGVKQYMIVENGALAVEAVQTGNFDLVLMDCHMPEMDGYDATLTIRGLEDPVQRMIPIIAMTANAMLNDEQNCLAIGMDAYISKPVSIPVFKHKLSTWVNFEIKKEDAP